MSYHSESERRSYSIHDLDENPLYSAEQLRLNIKPYQVSEPPPPPRPNKTKTYRDLWEETEIQWDESSNPFCLAPPVQAPSPRSPSSTSTRQFRRRSSTRSNEPLLQMLSGDESSTPLHRKISPGAPRNLRKRRSVVAPSSSARCSSPPRDTINKPVISVARLSSPRDSFSKASSSTPMPTNPSSRESVTAAAMVLQRRPSKERNSAEPMSARLPPKRCSMPEVQGRSKTDPNFDKVYERQTFEKIIERPTFPAHYQMDLARVRPCRSSISVPQDKIDNFVSHVFDTSRSSRDEVPEDVGDMPSSANNTVKQFMFEEPKEKQRDRFVPPITSSAKSAGSTTRQPTPNRTLLPSTRLGILSRRKRDVLAIETKPELGIIST